MKTQIKNHVKDFEGFLNEQKLNPLNESKILDGRKIAMYDNTPMYNNMDFLFSLTKQEMKEYNAKDIFCLVIDWKEKNIKDVVIYGGFNEYQKIRGAYKGDVRELTSWQLDLIENFIKNELPNQYI